LPLLHSAPESPRRVTVAAGRPLLQALLWTNAQRTMLLYGPADATFTLEQATELDGAWQPAYTNLTIPNLTRVLSDLPRTNRSIFYRLRRE